MKILHIAPDFKWSQIFILPIANKQYEEGNQVWLSSPKDEIYSRSEDNNQVRVVSWNKKYSDFFQHIFSIFILVRMVRKLKIDKIYAHTTIDSILYIFFLRIFTSANLTYVNHGVPYLGYYGLFRYLLKLVEIVNLNFSHRTLVINNSMKKLLIPYCFKGKSIISLRPGTLIGVNIPYKSYQELIAARNSIVSTLDNPNKVLRIIYVGRLEKRKGIYDLLEALQLSNINFELIVLGGNEKECKFQYQNNNVKFLGFKIELSSYYLNSDILCVPSHHEGFGQVYLEAASYGVIPICCNIPGPTDFIIHGLNGFVVEPKSPQSIVDILDQIYQNKYDLDEIRKNAYDMVQVYENQKVIFGNMGFFK